MSNTYELIIIGGGTAALSALDEALQCRVKSIALIDKREHLGGSCAWDSCVPTKTMLTAARELKRLKQLAPQYGIQANDVKVDFKTLMAKVYEVTHAGKDELDQRVTRFKGTACFVSANTVQVGDTVIEGEKIIIATGSQSLIPHIDGLEAGYLTYEQATHLETLPKSMLIVGGGPVGVEFAQMFQWLGCEVILLQKDDALLKTEEPEVQTHIQTVLEQDGVKVLTGCRIESAQYSNNGANKSLCVERNGSKETYTAEEILMVTGMQPQLAELNLEKAAVIYDKQSIKVNEWMQTNQPYIWAIGDVVGPYRFTHVADVQAAVAIRHAFQHHPKPIDYKAVAWAIYTEPSIAHVGLTAAQAQEQGYVIDIAHATTHQVSRYRIESEPDGFAKIVIEKNSGRLLGAHLIASQAEDVLHTLILAIQNEMTAAQLLDMFYVYPTKSQLIQKALENHLRYQ